MLHAARVFFDRTFVPQVERNSPFSLWDWGQYHASGIPDLKSLQHVLEGLLAVGALALFWWPRRRSPLRFAALTAAVLIGFEIVLTHWFFLYLPWFFLRRVRAARARQPRAGRRGARAGRARRERPGRR